LHLRALAQYTRHFSTHKHSASTVLHLLSAQTAHCESRMQNGIQGYVTGHDNARWYWRCQPPPKLRLEWWWRPHSQGQGQIALKMKPLQSFETPKLSYRHGVTSRNTLMFTITNVTESRISWP